MGKKKKEETLPPEAEAAELNNEVEPIVVGEEDGSTVEEPVDYCAEAEQNKDLYLRALADLANYRKRAQREKEDAIRFANDSLLREIIPVVDNLERAVEHAGSGDDQDKNLLEGVQMTLEQFRKVLESFGIKVVGSLGEVFDSNFHQAMGQMVTSEHPPNTVVQELQKGYTLNDRLLRPAMVMVAKAPEPESVENASDDAPESETEQDGSSATE